MKFSVLRNAVAAFALTAVLSSAALAGGEPVAMLKNLATTKISGWANNPVVIAAIKAQNAKYASLTQAGIDKLDKTWRAEVKDGGGPLISSTLSNKLSAYLKKVKQQAGGLYTEIFVEDNKGLNVGQSDVTSDYWQGDEAKWQKTFLVGPKAVHVSKIKMDKSSQALQAHVSMTITDPATGKPIGAVTVGVNADQLAQQQ